jgi:23S rRNA pseudouridine1911/1915/1917 synthase
MRPARRLGDVEVTLPAGLDGERTDRVVAMVTGLARGEAAALVVAGRVARNGHQVRVRSQRLRAGDRLAIVLPEPSGDSRPRPDAGVAFAVVFADDDLVIVDKPPGLVVHPGSGHSEGTLVNGLLARFPDLGEQPWPDPVRPGIVHRLDKGTSGLLVVARTVAAMSSLAAQLHDRTIERRYLALAWGALQADSGIIDAPVGRSVRDPIRMAIRADGRRAVTNYDVVRRFGGASPTTLLSCRLETGRTHQIRVHLAAIGHPVVGDDRYRGRGRVGQRRISRPFLHAEALTLHHPSGGQRTTFRAPLAPDLEALLAELD